MRECNTQAFRWLAFKVQEEDHHVGNPEKWVGTKWAGSSVPEVLVCTWRTTERLSHKSGSQSRDELCSGRMGEGSWEPHEVAVIQARVVGGGCSNRETNLRGLEPPSLGVGGMGKSQNGWWCIDPRKAPNERVWGLGRASWVPRGVAGQRKSPVHGFPSPALSAPSLTSASFPAAPT